MIRYALPLTFLLLSGCSTTTSKGYWGAGVSWPNGQRLRNSAIAAVRNPQVWAPLAGAAVFGLTDLDQEVSDWAVKETPLFGENASLVSDRLRTFSTAAYFATAVIAPSDSLASRARGLTVGASTLLIEQGTVGVLKSVTNRTRPNGTSDHGFPSGHTSRATVSATMAAANLDYMGMPGWARASMQTGLYGAAAATGWARVEAEKHYPSDVLMGYAFGQFLARFMYGAFMHSPGKNPEDLPALSFMPIDGGGVLTLIMPLRSMNSRP